MMRARDFAGMRVLVMGLGRFGGGIGVTRWLVEQGANVTVTDQAPAAELADSMRQLDGLPIAYRLGGHDERDLAGIDLLVVSPAVDKNKSSFFQASQARGIPWTTETNLFLERCEAQIVAITGSAGKSTTTAMIGNLLTAGLAGRADAPRVVVGGNIGRSLLQELPRLGPRDIVVLEISSFQLEDSAAIRIGPSHAVLTNLQPNHLDRHGTFEAYADAKMNSVRFLSENGTIVYNADDAVLRRLVEEVRPERPSAGVLRSVSYADRTADVHVEDGVIVARRGDRCEPVVPIADLGVPGRHNVYNAMMAIAAGRLYGVDDASAVSALRAFRGLPHRLEFVAEVDGVRYVNDSKCTTPEAALTAIDAFEAPVVVIVGGYDKGSEFDLLGQRLAARARGVVCLGVTGPKIEAEVRRHAVGGRPEIRSAASFEDAVAAARALARRGDVVLMSPACASWDMFTNYEERGELFKEIVRSWISG